MDMELGEFLSNKTLTLDEKIDLFRNYLEGLNRIHSLQFLVNKIVTLLYHGDLKGPNVMVKLKPKLSLGITDFNTMGLFTQFLTTPGVLHPSFQKKAEIPRNPCYSRKMIHEDLSNNGQKIDVWSSAIVLSGLLLNQLEFSNLPLIFLAKRVVNSISKTSKNLQGLTQEEIDAEMDRFIIKSENPIEKELWELVKRLFVIDLNKQITIKKALEIFYLITAKPGDPLKVTIPI
jgi:serine/threonine protein kinase